MPTFVNVTLGGCRLAVLPAIGVDRTTGLREFPLIIPDRLDTSDSDPLAFCVYCLFAPWLLNQELKTIDSCRSFHCKAMLVGCFPRCGFDSTGQNSRESDTEGTYTETGVLGIRNMARFEKWWQRVMGECRPLLGWE